MDKCSIILLMGRTSHRAWFFYSIYIWFPVQTNSQIHVMKDVTCLIIVDEMQILTLKLNFLILKSVIIPCIISFIVSGIHQWWFKYLCTSSHLFVFCCSHKTHPTTSVEIWVSSPLIILAIMLPPFFHFQHLLLLLVINSAVTF